MALTLDRKSLSEEIVGWIDEALDSGMDADSAYAVVAERVRTNGLLEAVFDIYGGELVSWVYRDRAHHVREAAFREAVAPPSESPAQRRVDLEALQDESGLLESLFKVGSEWVRLGDMQRKHCGVMRSKYRTIRETSAKREAFFEALEEKLKDDRTVRQLFSEDELRALYAEHLPLPRRQP